MGVLYNNSNIIPAPLVNITKDIQVAGDGTKLGTLYNGTITGELVAWKGSPQGGTLSGPDWGGPFSRFWQTTGYPPDESIQGNSRLASIESKQEALRALFATDGQLLQFQSADGSTPLQCQPRIKSITFGDGLWYQESHYTIVFECDTMTLTGSPEVDNVNVPTTDLISSATESWQIEDADVAKTFRLSHSMSATGKRRFDASGNQIGLAWQGARDFVQNTLAVGFNTTTGFSPIGGTTIVGSSMVGSGSVINFSTLNPYNFTRAETVDEWAGTYSLVENWTLSQAASGTDVFSINIRKMSTEPNTTTTVGVQGTIRGFYTQLNDYDGRFNGAQYVWSQLQGTGLYSRVQSYAPSGIIFNNQAVIGAVDYNPLEGTITYNYEYSDRTSASGAYEEYTISKNFSYSDYRTTISIDGRIIGRRFETDTDPNQKFVRAQTLWNTLKTAPGIYNRVVQSQFFPEVNNLKQTPASFKVDMNQPEGVISYMYEFNDRTNDNEINDETVHEEYNLGSSFNRDDGRTVYTINGTIEGLASVEGSGARQAKYAAASGYFFYVTQPNILPRILTIATALSYTNPIEYEIVNNTSNGTIQYSYKYSNEPAPYYSGALSEIISIQNNNALGNMAVFAEIPVLGRVPGPVLQDMSTIKVKSRSMQVETVFPPATGSLLSAYNAKPVYDSIIAQLFPPAGTVFVDDDTENWTPRNGRYTRTIRWIYQ